MVVNTVLSSRTPLSPEQAEAVQVLRGRYEATWKLVEAGTADLPPRIAEAVTAAQGAYFTPEVRRRSSATCAPSGPAPSRP